MQDRCNNKKSKLYKYYGGKGITLHEDWEGSSDNFIQWSLDNGYTDDLEIDRIDNNKGYSPNNCRWINKSTNCCNRGLKSTNSSGFIGVTIDREKTRKKPYRVFIRHKGKCLF